MYLNLFVTLQYKNVPNGRTTGMHPGGDGLYGAGCGHKKDPGRLQGHGIKKPATTFAGFTGSLGSFLSTLQNYEIILLVKHRPHFTPPILTLINI